MFKKIKPIGPRGFSGWEFPVMRHYMAACCDCGLVHELEFHVAEVVKEKRSGEYIIKRLPLKKYRVLMRARRAEGRTRQHRKER